jgi:hypothetical protein
MERFILAMGPDENGAARRGANGHARSEPRDLFRTIHRIDKHAVGFMQPRIAFSHVVTNPRQ